MQKKIIDKVENLLKNSLNIDNINLFSVEERGEVVEVNNSIIIVKGFSDISFEECVLIKDKFVGVVSLIRNDIIKIILLNKTNDISVGDKVVRLKKTLSIPVGEELIGRVIDGLGNAIDGKGKINYLKEYPVDRPATKILDRKSVKEPLQTGIKVIDSLVPIGRGQRELILGDRQTGKTSIAIDTILNQKNTGVICIYCSIGQRDSAIANIIDTFERNEAFKYTILVHVGPNESVGQQYIAPYSATSIGEYFMEKGKHVLIVYDDLSKHAKAYREISLLLEKSPGREAYPADIFYIHSKLLERSTKLKDELGGGSLTALPIIETEAENISAYIPTNVISITDGQIYLSPSMFQRNILPAIDVSKSVSRVGSAAQLPAIKQSVNILGIEYSQFEELESFSKFSSSLDEATEKTINNGLRIREILKQNIYEILEDYEEVAIFTALNSGVFCNVPLNKIKEAEKIVLNVLHSEDFLKIKNIVQSCKKIDIELINTFILSVKNKIEEQKWKI